MAYGKVIVYEKSGTPLIMLVSHLLGVWAGGITPGTLAPMQNVLNIFLHIPEKL